MRKINLVQHNGYLPRQWLLGSSPRVPGHVLADNSDLSLLEPQAWFRKQAQCRHQCRIAEIEVEANTKIRRSLIGRSRPKRGDYVLGDANSSGEQVKESISRKDTRTDPQETWVLKAAIRGSHTEQ